MSKLGKIQEELIEELSRGSTAKDSVLRQVFDNVAAPWPDVFFPSLCDGVPESLLQRRTPLCELFPNELALTFCDLSAGLGKMPP